MPEAVSAETTALSRSSAIDARRTFRRWLWKSSGTPSSRGQLLTRYACSLLHISNSEKTTGHFTMRRPRSKWTPPRAPARDVLAKVHVALGDYVSALSDFDTLAALVREQRPTPPDQYSIPAHFALHNVEQLDHILTSKRDGQTSAGVFAEQLVGLRHRLAGTIDGANGEAPWVSVNGTSGRMSRRPAVREGFR